MKRIKDWITGTTATQYRFTGSTAGHIVEVISVNRA